MTSSTERPASIRHRGASVAVAMGVMNLYIDLQNVVNRHNPEGVTYNQDYTRLSYTNGLPIFPSIGVEYLP